MGGGGVGELLAGDVGHTQTVRMTGPPLEAPGNGRVRRALYHSTHLNFIYTAIYEVRERVLNLQPPDPNPLYQRDDLVDRPRAMGV